MTRQPCLLLGWIRAEDGKKQNMSKLEEGSAQTGRVDRFGALASTTCAIHCAVCALVPAALATVGLDFLIGHDVEWTLTVIAVAFGIGAIVLSWRSHRNTLILAALSVGIVGLLAARILEGGHHDHHGEASHAEPHVESTEDGDHHDAHGDPEQSNVKHAEGAGDNHHEKEAAHDAHDEKHDDHGDGHMSIELLSIFAGGILVVGHLGNLALLRRKKEENGAAQQHG